MGRNWEETEVENKQYDSPSCESSLTIRLRRQSFVLGIIFDFLNEIKNDSQDKTLPPQTNS
ncbi:hypothetical protein T4C_6081 [Trichinella pseudospiralis]|uniref:Uncharacterized protein n=1 Tax=Trichinella pseudospiralis TaxID=6337 RepID=A0A0V1HFM2_TRIPS|nr:hypothetical protein T4C_6081 [Trichinella pseudospiralis]